jgi:BNR repeat-like domain
MEPSSRPLLRFRPLVLIAMALVSVSSLSLFAFAAVTLTQISEDTYTNTTSQHATQVEPHAFAFGNTIVAAFQTGRFFDGGASNIARATSTDGGANWVTGNLPGITNIDNNANPYDRVSDPSVAYDARHNVWLISSLAINEVPGGITGAAVLVSRSTDGGFTWGSPVTVATATGGSDLDKNWTVCDNTPASPFYGHCYTQFDDFGEGNRIKMSTSTDGGLTWGTPKNTANNATGIGGQPVVQPDGTVIVPIADAFETAILAFVSTDGGASWSRTRRIARVRDHTVAGDLRSGPLPSAAIDGGGTVYVVWHDCRFRFRCSSNDIVMSTSTNGISWTAPVRIPIDATNSGVDHFIPGLAADRSTSGSSARLGLTYYYYPDALCSPSTCELTVGFISSADGGATWGTPIEVAGPMTLSWLPDTNQGRMVGDYIATAFNASHTAHGVFAVANVPTAGGTDCATATPDCDQGIYTTAAGLSAAVGATPVDRQPVNAASDHAAPQAVFHRR